MAGPGARDQESRWKQYLEDERIALFLQNEEFMKELQRNRDFLLALERGGAPGGAPCPFSMAEEVADVGCSLGAQARQGLEAKPQNPAKRGPASPATPSPTPIFRGREVCPLRPSSFPYTSALCQALALA